MGIYGWQLFKAQGQVREQRVKSRRLKAKSRAGNTAKIHLAVDGYGLPVEFEITGAEVNDCSAAPDCDTESATR